jgi:hypothetical protein
MTRIWDAPVREAALPVIVVSSRDNAPVPRVAGAISLERLAAAHGWAVEQTYSCCEEPDRFFANGRLAKAAHTLHAVAVRMVRGRDRAWAAWHCEGEGGWRYTYGGVNAQVFGLRELRKKCGKTRRIVWGYCPVHKGKLHCCTYNAPGHRLHICACGSTWEE